MKRFIPFVAIALVGMAAPVQAQQPTIMDLIAQAKANNDALALKVSTIEAKVDALNSKMDAMAAYLSKGASAVVVTTEKPTEQHSMMMMGNGMAMAQAGSCGAGGCGGSGTTRMRMRMRSR